MFGRGAKSGRFRYYICATAYRNGRDACHVRPVPHPFIESQVLEKVRQLILQEEHLE